MSGVNMNSTPVLDISTLDREAFKNLCKSILELRGPDVIDEYGEGNAADRDCEFHLPSFSTASNSEIDGNVFEQRWLIEFKDDGSGNTENDFPNRTFDQKKGEETVHRTFVYMTNISLPREVKLTFAEFKKHIDVEYLDKKDIEDILLSNPEIVKENFPGLDEHSYASIPKPKTKKIFINMTR